MIMKMKKGDCSAPSGRSSLGSGGNGEAGAAMVDGVSSFKISGGVLRGSKVFGFVFLGRFRVLRVWNQLFGDS